MKLLDTLHRWAGGIVGLVLAIMGLTGTLLVWRDKWTFVSHAGDALVTDPAAVGRATARIMAEQDGVQSIIYASDRLGLHQLRLPKGAGTYADQTGAAVTQWTTQWERPELWIFDLHHHLFTGDVGETIIGIAGLCALFFVVSGAVLWWRTRKTFKFRLLPARMSRPAIVMHHRDLGIVLAPLLFLSALTGTMMIFRPVAEFVVAPFGGPAIAKAMAPPKVEGGALSPTLDWQAIIATASRRFPDAQVRTLSVPSEVGEPISMRMKRADEWLPNGRTLLLFDPADGKLLAARDALTMPANAQVFNKAYPLHAAKVGGLLWRLAITITGVAMMLLGSLALWSFWFKRPKPKARPR